MPDRSKRHELDAMEGVLRSSGGRAPLYRWLRQHHDWFAARLNGQRPDWQALADGFSERLGLRMADGRPLTAERVRQTWWRVRRDVAATRATRRLPEPPAVRVVVLPPAVPVPEPPAPQGGGDALANLRRQLNQRSGRNG